MTWNILDLIKFTCNAPVSCNPPPPDTYGDGQGIAVLLCGAVTFWVPPQSGFVILCKYIHRGIYYYKEQSCDSQQVTAVQGF